MVHFPVASLSYMMIIPLKKKVQMRVRFMLRKSRINKLGFCPIEYSVRIKGVQSTRYAASIFVHPTKWDSTAQKIKGNSFESETNNTILEEIRFKLKNIFEQQMAVGVYLSAKELCEIFHGKRKQHILLSDLFAKRLEDMLLRGRSKATLEIHKRHHNLLFNFIGEDLEINSIQRRHVQGFWNDLRRKNYDHDYCNKIVMNVKGAFIYAFNNWLIDKNPFDGTSLEWRNDIDLTFLTECEVLKLQSIIWSDRLQKVVDSFLFMCFTGLHISDYIKLTIENIVVRNGRKWLQLPRTKTKVEAIVPFHSVAERISEKYGGIEFLPRISTQKMNDYLKVIAEKSAITKNLTNKVARKTFTDMCINTFSMSEESVAAMLGHKSTKYVRRYGSVRHERILLEWKDREIKNMA